MATRKKPRSAKQKANDRRLGAMARARGRKSTPKRRTTKRKTIKRRSPRKTMPKRRSPPRKSTKGKIINRIPILKNPAVKEIAMGLGMARIVTTVGSRVPIAAVQNNARLLGTAAAFAVDLKAGIVDLALNGGLGAITNLAQGSGGNQNNGGFA